MYLYCCILIGGAIILTCCAESPSTHATSSLSYDLADVSLSYKYNLIHLYTTTKPLYQSKQNFQNKNQLRSVVNHQNIQYAPLLLKAKENYSTTVLNRQEESQKPELNTEINASMFDIENEDRELRQDQKRNLFPLAVTEPIEAYPRKYVPGYNVNLQAVINKLKQNGIYARNPNFLVKNKQVNVKYLQPQASYKNQSNLQGPTQNYEAITRGYYAMLTFKNPQDGQKNNGIIRPVNGHNENRPFFYVKAPIVQLNLARAQHIARALHKAPVKVNSSFRKLPSLPHEFFSNKQNLQPSNSNTFTKQQSIYHPPHWYNVIK